LTADLKTETELLDEVKRLRARVAELEAAAASPDPSETQRRRQELALSSQLTQLFATTLDLDAVIGSVLEETHRLLNVAGTSIWLLDAQAQELVCWQSTGEGGEIVRGWRLGLDEGLVGWVARSGQTLVVADASADARHVVEVDQQTGLPMRSILSVPLKVKDTVIGVLQVLDTEPDRFGDGDLALVEPLASAAAVAIDNARLYQEADRLRAYNENIVQSMEEGILMADAEGRITFVNRRTAELLHYPLDALLGQPWRTIIDRAHVNQVAVEAERHTRGIGARYETVLRTRDGVRVPVLVSARPLYAEERFTGVLAVFTDITALQAAQEELRESQEKLERARRMESLGVLAGGVAHDLNNLLGPMMAYPDLILMDLPPKSPLREDVRQIKLAAQRSAAMVRDLLTLARRGVYRMGHLSLNMVINEYLGSLAFSELLLSHPQVALELDLAADLPNVLGSPIHLSKVIMNLVTNAFEAMPDGGTLTLSTAYLALEQDLAGYETIGAGEYCVLCVRDTGVGIEAEDMERIFEPFYTKKELGRSGTGLGLAVVYGVAHDHEARIDVQTEVGAGSTFSLYFPVAAGMSLPFESEEADYSGHESVLVVDDVQEQRDVARRLLSSLGYRVTAVANGREAIEALRREKADILVLDMLMGGGFDGLETFRQALALYPELRAVIASGFSETKRVREAQDLGAGPFVRKPYTLHSLAKAVRSELDRE
jgi:PAS domain S-box-containing protein